MSPIPVPAEIRPGQYDLGSCIRALRREGKPSDQRLAICLKTARKAHGKKEPKKK